MAIIVEDTQFAFADIVMLKEAFWPLRMEIISMHRKDQVSITKQ